MQKEKRKLKPIFVKTLVLILEEVLLWLSNRLVNSCILLLSVVYCPIYITIMVLLVTSFSFVVTPED